MALGTKVSFRLLHKLSLELALIKPPFLLQEGYRLGGFLLVVL
jgi:hypothetical protein